MKNNDGTCFVDLPATLLRPDGEKCFLWNPLKLLPWDLFSIANRKRKASPS
jgi:hypothetical protein